MRNVIMLLCLLLLSCGSNASKEPSDLDRAKEAVMHYCNHAYTDYKPDEWFNLHSESPLSDKRISALADSVRNYAVFIKQTRETLRMMKGLYNGSFDSPEVERRYNEVDSLYRRQIQDANKKWSQFVDEFSELYKSFKPTYYVIGHTFSHKVIHELRKLDLQYFILTPKMQVVGVKDENPMPNYELDLGPNV